MVDLSSVWSLKFRCSMIVVVYSAVVVQWMLSLWMMVIPPPCLLVRFRCAIFGAIRSGGGYVGS